MKKLGRRPFLASTLAIAACGGGRPAPPEPRPAGSTLVPPPPPAPIPSAARRTVEPTRYDGCTDAAPDRPLAALTGISNAAPSFDRLSSFTTSEQIAGIRRGDPILAKTATDAGHRGHVFDVLAARAKAGDKTAELLAGPAFERGRFAWPFLAAIRLSPERYGDEILSFVLKPEAIVVSIATSRSSYAWFDASGRPLTEHDASREPSRIGVFFFVNDVSTVVDTTGTRCSNGGAGLLYREFYLGNVAMLAEASLGTQAILDRIAAESADLRALAEGLDCQRRLGTRCDAIAATWNTIGPTRPEKLLASLAFAQPFSGEGLLPRDLVRVAEDLEALRFEPNPLVLKF